MKNKILLVMILTFYTFIKTREDCVGISYKDEEGIGRNNQTKDLTFHGYAQCLCSCKGEWTSWGMCKQCRHPKKPNFLSKKAPQNRD